MAGKVIKIDENRCSGCGACASACHQDAISMVNGKAKLVRDDYCDGLGKCLPACPCGAISLEEKASAPKAPFACPGMTAKSIARNENAGGTTTQSTQSSIHSSLKQWPVQIKLVPPTAPYFENANLLVAADCAAYAYGNFHNDYMKGKITIIGCPKLDDVDYSDKLTAILKNNNIKSVTVTRMEVPCCGGLETAVKTALQNCGRMIPWQVVTLSTDGGVVEG